MLGRPETERWSVEHGPRSGSSAAHGGGDARAHEQIVDGGANVRAARSWRWPYRSRSAADSLLWGGLDGGIGHRRRSGGDDVREAPRRWALMHGPGRPLAALRRQVRGELVLVGSMCPELSDAVLVLYSVNFME
ncbi:vegetative cell wall protein gp1 [Iris pallida]|uniref:Vegetative cell wall protein gp1 n=1 Tax=Iris pallida TaxID=29817 RepID=A0AAX6I2M5_IRIPA|nr:vegetative cell wall protein gp1 [Iris pallida]